MQYQLGVRVKVPVVRVDIESAKIDFVLVEGADGGRAAAREMPHAVPVPVTKKPRVEDQKRR